MNEIPHVIRAESRNRGPAVRAACVTRMMSLQLLLALPAALQAQFTFVTNNGAITITKYKDTGGAVTIPSETNGLPVTSIGTAAFFNTSVTSVTIPNSVTNLGTAAFRNCTGLTGVTIPQSVTTIGSVAFDNCRSLTNALIPASVTTIGHEAFSFCYSLVNVTLPSSLSNVESNLFYHCTSLRNITVPGSVTNIQSHAFFYCLGLTNVTLPNSLAVIGPEAFGSCTSLTGVTIPDAVISIGDGAFAASGLTGIAIPNSVAHLGVAAFSFCQSLTNVSIGIGVTNIGWEAFAECTRLVTIVVDALNPSYSSADGVLFDFQQAILIRCPGAKAGNYTIPDSVRSIGERAFAYCGALTNIIITDSVTAIGLGAFANCQSLTSATIPGSVIAIEDGSFSGCTNLRTIVIGSNIGRIGYEAFLGCTNLSEVYFKGNIPGSVPAHLFEYWNDERKTYLSFPATVYYMPGAIGWGPTFGGCSTAPWVLPHPLILTTGPGFGFQTNRFGFRISWATNASVVVEACASLANPNWLRVGTNALSEGWSFFSDREWTNDTSRFYRVRPL